MTKQEALESSPEYFKRYIKYVLGDDVCETMEREHLKALEFYQKVPKDKQEYRYDTGKWHIKEILRHIIDTERIMATRALAFAREDNQAYPGFNQDQYVLHSAVDKQEYSSLLDEFDSLRRSNIHLFNSFDHNMMERHGRWENNTASVEVIGFIIIGHEIHHRRVISDRILELL